MGGKRVLVIEDECDIRELVASILSDYGFEIQEAENGQVGLNLLSGSRPDVILLDLMMPVMTGWEMLDALSRDSQLCDIPVVVVSASQQLSRMVPDDLADDVLQKPFTIDGLLEKVEYWTSRVED